MNVKMREIIYRRNENMPPLRQKLPPTLRPQFGVYAVLTIVAIVCAVYFRPFLNGPAIGEVSQGVLWVAVIIFIVFAVIFLGVSVIIMRDYKNRTYRGKLTTGERTLC